jgi:hypothetical protein
VSWSSASRRWPRSATRWPRWRASSSSRCRVTSTGGARWRTPSPRPRPRAAGARVAAAHARLGGRPHERRRAVRVLETREASSGPLRAERAAAG